MKRKIAKHDEPLVISGQTIMPGERKRVHIDVAGLHDFTREGVEVEVIRGTEEGPTLFISGAIHGDEINGTEIIRRVLNRRIFKNIKGTLIAVPIVNVFGFNTLTRYLPDRRDLNRSFPGSENGALASQLAKLFMKEVVAKCTHGIDFHTAAIHRSNLPQIRACLDDKETEELAKVFGVPVILHSKLRDGSLREAARKKDIPVLLFEGGEALRFDEDVIRAGVKGCISVMRKIGMIKTAALKKPAIKKARTYVAKGSHWVRAPHSGMFILKKKLGAHVEAGDVLAVISDPFGRNQHDVLAEEAGIVVGKRTLPLVHKGDAMFHIAVFRDSARVKNAINLFDELL